MLVALESYLDSRLRIACRRRYTSVPAVPPGIALGIAMHHPYRRERSL